MIVSGMRETTQGPLVIKAFVAYYRAPVPFSFCKPSSSVDKTRVLSVLSSVSSSVER